MPWRKLSMTDSRLQFVQEAGCPGVNFSALCAAFGISRKTGYATLKRYHQSGKAGLENKSSKPNTSPYKTSVDVESQVLLLRKINPHWGGRKLRKYLMSQGFLGMPSEKTINRILKRYGCINPEESVKHKPFIRFEHEHPNDLWQMDFKGHFQVGEQRCYPLTLLDDHSRFSLAIISCGNEQKPTVISSLIDVFRTYGLPKRMTMDNGKPWGDSREQCYTEIDVWLIRLGIRVTHSRPYHPQTQGKLERFHRTLKLELLSEYCFDDLEHAQQGFDWWRRKYNEDRPHEGIGLEVPRSRYHVSERAYPEILPPIEYPASMDVIRVNSSGRISYKGRDYMVGRSFSGEYIGIKERGDNEQFLDVYYCKQRVLELCRDLGS